METFYLIGNPLIIKTDQHSLKYMASQRLTEGIQHKLLLKLLEFDYTTEYKKGKENLVADALSRKDTSAPSTCNNITVVIPQWIEDVKKSYEADPDSSKLLHKVAADTDDQPKFSTANGIIKYKNRIYVGAAHGFRTKSSANFPFFWFRRTLRG